MKFVTFQDNFVTLKSNQLKIGKKKYRFNPKQAFGVFHEFLGRSKNRSTQQISYNGLELRLFVPKSNRLVADKFPVRGVCRSSISVSGVDNWTLFEINSEFSYAGHKNNQVIIRPKNAGDSLKTDKVEIILLFIPIGSSLSGNLDTKQLHFTGKAFARPI